MSILPNNAVRYDRTLFVRCPSALPAMVATAAAASMLTASGYVRLAIVEKLRRDGFAANETN
jgi:hypothetical protein